MFKKAHAHICTPGACVCEYVKKSCSLSNQQVSPVMCQTRWWNKREVVSKGLKRLPGSNFPTLSLFRIFYTRRVDATRPCQRHINNTANIYTSSCRCNVLMTLSRQQKCDKNIKQRAQHCFLTFGTTEESASSVLASYNWGVRGFDLN